MGFFIIIKSNLIADGGNSRKDSEEKKMEKQEVATQTQESVDEDVNLDDLDISELETNLFEDEAGKEPTETKPEKQETIPEIADDEVIKIGDEEVPLKEAIDAYKNKNNWQQSNTQEAQRIAKEKKRLEEEQRHIEEEKARIEMLVQQQQLTPQQQQSQPPESKNPLEDLGIDPEDVDPATKAILDRLQKQEQRFNEWQQQLEEQQFITQSKMQHEKLKGTFADYNPNIVEQAILKGRDPFEDTYKALKYDAITKGDANSIKSIIPKEIIEEIKRETRKQLIEDLRKREKKVKGIASSTPTGQSLSKMPSKAPSNYIEAKMDVMNMLAEEGISLTE